MYRWKLKYFLIVVAVSTSMALPALIVATNYGLVKGVFTLSLLNQVFYSFLGIPYAKPPIGDLRFKDPQIPQPWTGLRCATREPIPCWERNQFSGAYHGSEDCLYLNVFTRNPFTIRLKPVIVFIHGGAYMFGSSSLNFTGPDYIMQKDVVLVTLNFRQGVFGFLSVSDNSYNIPGNFGLKDQSFALRWIKDNIQNFGGDPNNILLFGYSSGANAVNYHMLSDWSENLFNKAMLMSGSVLNARFILPEAKDLYVERLADFVGWNKTGGLRSAVNYLRTANSSLLVRAQFEPNFLLSEDKMKGVRYPYGPVIETNRCAGFLTIDPRLKGRHSWSKGIPVTLSSAANEALLLRPAAEAKGDTLLSTINFAQLVPYDTGGQYSDNELEALGKKIRNFYFRDENASQGKILDDYVQMETDRLYVHGMYRTAISRLRGSPHQATYMYRFSVQSWAMNLFRILKCGQHCHGTSHGDDLSYIFRNFLVKSVNDIGESEMKAVSRMVNIIYNFATKNDPNWNETNGTWVPLNEQNSENYDFKVLNIGSNLTLVKLPELEGMQLWSSFYDPDYLT